MKTKLLGIFLGLSSLLLFTCQSRDGTKEEEETKAEEKVIPKLIISLTIPDDAPDGFFEVTLTLQTTPKAQGPFTKTAYNKADASTHELPNISVKGTRNVTVKVEDSAGVGILRGSGVISETSTEVTISLEKIPAEEADPAECAGFSAKIDTINDGNPLSVESKASAPVRAEIDNPAGVSIAYAWSTEKGATVDPTDEQDTIFTAPEVTTETPIKVILKIKPESAGEVTCNEESIRITVKPLDTDEEPPPPPPPGDATITLSVTTSKAIPSGEPALTPKYPTASFETTVTSDVQGLTYSWYKDEVLEESMGTGPITNPTSTFTSTYTVPPEVFTQLQTEYPPEASIKCIPIKFKLLVTPINKYSEEKTVSICNQDIEMDTVCDAVVISMNPFTADNITDIPSLTYTLPLTITNFNPDVYKYEITKFISTCENKPCGPLTVVPEAEPIPTIETYTWNTQTDNQKSNYLYKRSREFTFTLEYSLPDFIECTPLSLDYKVVSQNVIPHIGNVAVKSGEMFTYDTIPYPTDLHYKNTFKPLKPQCLGIFSGGSMITGKYDIEEDLLDEDDWTKFGFAFDGYGLDRRINVKFLETLDAGGFDTTVEEWWDPAGGDTYNIFYLSLCLDEDVTKNPEFVAETKEFTYAEKSPAPDKFEYTQLVTPEETIMFQVDEFAFYQNNFLFGGAEPVSGRAGIDDSTTITSFGSFVHPLYWVTPWWKFDQDDPDENGDLGNIQFGLDNSLISYYQARMYFCYENLDWTGASDTECRWWPSAPTTPEAFVDTRVDGLEVDNGVPQDDAYNNESGARALYATFGYNPAYRNHFHIETQEINLLSGDDAIIIPDGFEPDECSKIPYINQTQSAFAYDDGFDTFDVCEGICNPDEENYSWGYKLTMDENNKIDYCVMACEEDDNGGCDPKDNCHSPIQDNEKYHDEFESASINVLLVCTKFYTLTQ